MTIKEKGKPNHLLRKAREDAGLTQQELAGEIKTTPANIGRWERGKNFPGPFFREQLCRFFHKSNDQLGLISREYLRASGEEEEESQSRNLSEIQTLSKNLLQITPASLAKRTSFLIDTLTDAYFRKWIMPRKDETLCSYQFTHDGLRLVSKATWPLAICFAQAITLAPPFALQVDMTFLPTGTDPLLHSGGIAFGVTGPFDNAMMKRIRIGSNSTYDIYVQSDDQAFSGRLNPCPSLTDPDAQSTLHNDFDDPTSTAIRRGINKTNTIMVVVGERLITLYVNGQKLQTVCDRQGNTGMIGLFAAPPYENEVTDALFTNLTVWTKF